MSPRRVPELDALRGIAAVGIVMFHYTMPGRANDAIFYTGALSLELFFVLSGFLITTIILANCGNDGFLMNFYARRGLRIYPIYYLLILVLVAVHWRRPGVYSLEGLPYYLTYTQNIQRYWFGAEPPLIYPIAHTWSLAVEEQYYIIWPVMVCLLGRRSVVPLAFVFMAVAVAARAYGFSPQILIGRCDGFALGGLLAAVLSDADRVRRRPRAYRLAFGLVGFAALNYLTWVEVALGQKPFTMGMVSPTLDILLVGVFFFAVVGLAVCYAGHPALAPLRAGPLCYLGQISYGIYLYHLAILTFFDPTRALGVTTPWVVIALKMAACVALSAISWSVIERPVLSLKDRFRYDSNPARQGSLPTSDPGRLSPSREPG